jgi:hypothetical protein
MQKLHAGKIDKRQQQIEESVQRYLDMIETADRTSPIGFDVKTVLKKLARDCRSRRRASSITDLMSPSFVPKW